MRRVKGNYARQDRASVTGSNRSVTGYLVSGSRGSHQKPVVLEWLHVETGVRL
jgi:hypothetical protein